MAFKLNKNVFTREPKISAAPYIQQEAALTIYGFRGQSRMISVSLTGPRFAGSSNW